MVCTQSSQEILHEAVLPIRLDPRRPSDRRDPVLLNHQEYF
jgi:hypothetical protein